MSKEFVLLALIMVVIITFPAGFYVQESSEIVTVQKKFIDVSRQGSHYILVTDKGVFEVERPWWKAFEPKYNSDIVYSSIDEGKTYRLHYTAWRQDWLYWYPLVFFAEPAQ